MGAEWEPKGVKRMPKGGKGAQWAPFAEQERKSEEKRAEKHGDGCEKGAQMESKTMRKHITN